MYELYFSWSRDTGRTCKLLHEPQTDAEPAMLVISGRFSYGYLLSEAGLHRHRSASLNSATRVTVAPEIVADEGAPNPALSRQEALKQRGRYGGKIRSLVELTATSLVLKNDLSIVENTDVVRRYDTLPFFVKDYASDSSSGRRDQLRHEAFTELLATRAKLLLAPVATASD